VSKQRSDRDKDHDVSNGGRSADRAGAGPVLGKSLPRTTGQLAGWVQMRRDGAVDPSSAPDTAQAIAASGTEGAGQKLPHLDTIQQAFGRHDVSAVEAHVGGTASDAAGALGAHAYASGNQVAFRADPDLHLAAHEAAHVVQQRAGVYLKDGFGDTGDLYEQHADRVADAVVQGKSAEGLLDQMAPAGAGGQGSTAVQRDGDVPLSNVFATMSAGGMDIAFFPQADWDTKKKVFLGADTQKRVKLLDAVEGNERRSIVMLLHEAVNDNKGMFDVLFEWSQYHSSMLLHSISPDVMRWVFAFETPYYSHMLFEKLTAAQMMTVWDLETNQKRGQILFHSNYWKVGNRGMIAGLLSSISNDDIHTCLSKSGADWVFKLWQDQPAHVQARITDACSDDAKLQAMIAATLEKDDSAERRAEKDATAELENDTSAAPQSIEDAHAENKKTMRSLAELSISDWKSKPSDERRQIFKNKDIGTQVMYLDAEEGHPARLVAAIDDPARRAEVIRRYMHIKGDKADRRIITGMDQSEVIEILQTVHSPNLIADMFSAFWGDELRPFVAFLSPATIGRLWVRSENTYDVFQVCLDNVPAQTLATAASTLSIDEYKRLMTLLTKEQIDTLGKATDSSLMNRKVGRWEREEYEAAEAAAAEKDKKS
jgi:hypothetical protein